MKFLRAPPTSGVWHKLSTVLVHTKFMFFVSFVLVTSILVQGFIRGSFFLKRGQGLVIASIAECVVAFVLLAIQLYAKHQAEQGTKVAAHVMIIPVFEAMIWTMANLILTHLLFLLSDSPNDPPFLLLAIDPASVETSSLLDFIKLFCFFVVCDMIIWSVYFHFIEDSICHSAIARACRRHLIMSLICAGIELSGSVVSVELNLKWGAYLAQWIVRALAFAAYMHLAIKSLRSSRSSALPFAIMWCVLVCTELSVGTIYLAIENVPQLLSSPIVFLNMGVFKLMYNIFLYWTLVRDTKYWRGVSRVPVWCVGADDSPYDQISDSLIERDIPLLIHRPTVCFIDFAFLKFGPLIGTGATCRVFRGHVCIGHLKGKPVAIKVFTPIEISTTTLHEFANEIQQYERLQHSSRVMKLLGVCVRPPDVCMVCELCENGSLNDWLKTRTFSIEQKMKLSVQVSEAVRFTHSLVPPLIHRDLKSFNFLVTDSGDAKLSDFGTAKPLVVSAEMQDSNQRAVDIESHVGGGGRPRAMTKKIGSLEWMSPEVLRGSDSYDLKADIYSLGIVLWEIWSQQEPYLNVSRIDLADHVINGLRPAMPLNCPHHIANLITAMCDPDPSRRPNALETLAMLQEISRLHQQQMQQEEDHQLELQLQQLHHVFAQQPQPSQQQQQQQIQQQQQLSQPQQPTIQKSRSSPCFEVDSSPDDSSSNGKSNSNKGIK